MWTIGEIKQQGKNAFKANYFNSVIVAFLLSLLAGGTSASVGKQTSSEEFKAQLFALDPMIIYTLFALLSTIAIASLLLRIFLFNPLEVGGYRFFKKNVETQNATVGIIGEGFSNYGHIFITLFLRDLFLVLWTLLLFIPGIIKGYSYRMIPYILKDNPELSATEVITKSRQMMDGHKWHAFVLDLSFIGWAILSIITCGLVGIFWYDPYKQNTDAALYLELSKNQ